MKKKIKNSFVKSILTFFLTIILSSGILIVTLVLSSATLNRALFDSYFSSPLLLFMNISPIVLLMILLYFVFNRLWLSYLITVILFVGGGLINKFKLTYRDDPFVFRDIKLFTESLQMSKRYSLEIGSKLSLVIIFLLALTIFIKLFFNMKIRSLRVRLTNILFICLLIGLTSNFYYNDEVYAKVGDENLINRWVGSQQFQSKGFVYPFLYSAKELKESVPDNYNENDAKKVLSNYSYSDIEKEKRINVISIMLEAYNDFSKYDFIDIREDVYRDFHEIKNESISGNLITNVFAGGTINTERAFLTGYYDYLDFYRDTNSHVRYMKEQGYKTESMHPITGSFYNRRNVNEFLGFDNFDHYDNKFSYIQNEYLTDSEFFEYIIKGYENSVSEGIPYFHFSTTYQNHGPYSTEKLTTENYLVQKDSYNEESYNIINNYLSGIKATNEALKSLLNYFEQSEEPVVVILFGDHNPWLGLDNSVYKMLGINLDLSETQGFKNYYVTPYLIWGNNSAKQVANNDLIGNGEDLSPNHLMTEVFEQIGWEGNEFMQYLKDLKKEIAVNHALFFSENHELVKKEHISLPVKKEWDEYMNVEYYQMSKK